MYVGDSLDREVLNKCKYLPPRKLYHLVIPYKRNSKLMFLFTDTMNQSRCTHSDEERYKLRKCIADEVRTASEIGYNLLDVFEFWEYSVKYFEEDTNSGGLF